MTYVILDHDSEFAATDCPCKAVAIAHDRANFLGKELSRFVRVESRGIYGPYAAPELVGKPCIFDFDWRKGLAQLMG